MRILRRALTLCLTLLLVVVLALPAAASGGPAPDYGAILAELSAAATDPAVGVPLIILLAALNALFAYANTLRAGERFDRDRALNWLRTRVAGQAFPVAVVGIGAMFVPYKALHTLLSGVYLGLAAWIITDLWTDLKQKMAAWRRPAKE